MILSVGFNHAWPDHDIVVNQNYDAAGSPLDAVLTSGGFTSIVDVEWLDAIIAAAPLL
jgi:hypothetical protein